MLMEILNMPIQAVTSVVSWLNSDPGLKIWHWLIILYLVRFGGSIEHPDIITNLLP